MHRLFLSFFVVCLFALPKTCYSAFTLVKDGKSQAEIIRLRGSSAVEIFASAQLQEYVQKITGVTMSRVRRNNPGVYPVWIALADAKNLKLPEAAKNLVPQIRDDGFLLYSDASGLYIIAKERRGLNYGVYEILKRYGGVRWITPEADGEFFPKKSSFVVPALAEVVNPSFRYRNFNLVSAHVNSPTKTALWQVRNGMTQTGKTYGGGKQLGGHIFSTLLPDTYFHTQPELYGLYGGKRLPQCGDPAKITARGTGGMKNQPCTSNPETIRIMQENLVKMLKEHPDTESFCILNNDSTKWCECENCQKLDPPEEKRRGLVSTRFWLIANELIKAGKKNSSECSLLFLTLSEFPGIPHWCETG